MKSSDEKYYKTDVLDTENLLRLIQSIPSPKAESLKLWPARVEIEKQTGESVVISKNAKKLRLK